MLIIIVDSRRTYSSNEMESKMRGGEKRKGKAVVVGGSIAGVSCAHSLIAAGWEVVVVEKSLAVPNGSATGAGLGLDPLACGIISSWIGQSEPLNNATMPLTVDQNQAVDSESETTIIALCRDENFNFRAAHWADLHSLLVRSLPQEIFLWGHLYLSFQVVSHVYDDSRSVTVKVKAIQTGETAEIVADLLVAADGCLSSIRQTLVPRFRLRLVPIHLPNLEYHSLFYFVLFCSFVSALSCWLIFVLKSGYMVYHLFRYSGYCAWRGVLDFTGYEESGTIKGLRKAYPDLGRCLYFDLGSRTHTVLYELSNKRMNWLWYINQPEPQIKGNSVTIKVSDEMIKAMHEEAEKLWVPEFTRLVKNTKDPFLNVIYDAEPLDKIIWDNVVLVGDAAHPTTPHCLRSTNMSILDAEVLGRCLDQFGLDNLQSALPGYESTRLPVVRQQVLHARYLGRLKQGLETDSTQGLIFYPLKATAQDCCKLQQKSVPFFYDVPTILRHSNG